MIIRILRSMLLLLGMLGLISCGGGSGGGGADEDTLVVVQGQVINGPLVGATVSITDGTDTVLGSAITDAQGNFSIQLTNPVSPLLVVSDGGTLDGVPYSAQLRAYCSVDEDSATLSCHVTPYSSLIAQLVDADPELSVQQAAQKVFDVFGLDEDPFVSDNAEPDSVPLYFFDLDAARAAINGGAGLSSWLDSMAAWVNAPFVGAAPEGTPVYRVLLRQRTLGGTAGPDYVDVPMGGVAQFNMVPDANYVVESTRGCGGSLDGTVYTTAPIISASAVTGVCQVEVWFGLEKFSVKYVAGENGSITGDAEQSVSYGFDSSEVIATPDTGYEFVAWSDGWVDSDPENVPPVKRSDTNITEDLTVTAIFQRQQLTLTYQAETGGTITGDTEQTVFYGEDATEVVAAPTAGYDFVRWSDGLLTPQRTDRVVTSSATLTASFSARPESVPWSQGLHDGDISVRVQGPTRVELDWPTQPDTTYDLYIATDPETVLDQYALFGATLMADVVPPLTINGLTAEQPVYLALQANDVLSAWTSFVPRSWGLNGSVFAQARDPLGQRFVGGNFARVIQNVGGALSLPSATFTSLPDHGLAFPDVNGVVYAVAADGVGGWYIGGQFSSVNGEPRQNLARIDSAGNLLDWASSVGGPGAVVKSLYSSGLQLVVGGLFSSAAEAGEAGAPRSNLALFNESGELDSIFAPVVNGEVRAITTFNDAILVGGSFTMIGSVDAGGIGLISSDGTAVQAQGSFNGPVNTLLITDSQLVVGGEFTAVTVNGDTQPQSLLAEFELSETFSLPSRSWSFTGPSGMAVNALLEADGRLLVGGSFTAIDGSPRGGFAVIDADDGVLDSAIAVDGVVNAVVLSDGIIYLGGDYGLATGINGTQSRTSLAAFDEADNLLDWNPGLSGEVDALITENSVVTVAGQIRGASAQPRERLAAFDADGNLLPWAPAANNDVLSLVVHGDAVYAGGRFDQMGESVADTGRAYLGALDRQDGTLLPWNPGADGEVNALLSAGAVIYAGGNFSDVGGLSRQNLVAIDLTGVPLVWNPGANGSVDVLLADGGAIYAGGQFTLAGGGVADTARSYLAAFDTDGDLLGWNPAVDGRVRSMALLNGDIYVGGDFANAGAAVADTARENLAAFDSLGGLLAWSPGANGSVVGLSAADDVIYAVGDFTQVAGQPRVGLAALDSLAALLDWNPADIVQPYSVQAADGLISVTGGFTRLSGVVDAPRSGLALFDDSGELLAR
ncbi:hypothetical protein [Alcanivorax sp. 1008]|uniref:InlB B-repeat-containing protein n=1 Tax=Alcanivorax sp. 1008 TaxID=2816853 RepID=UPI001DBB8ACE|nr:hypothetical protein [Alcanivorax sp. 1008]MCC1497110.1 hypothetical protein [Alcanivorax sp. 1008]